jgi:D-glycero-D-manno-heptose 1,7-bisphosphate phosphatase
MLKKAVFLDRDGVLNACIIKAGTPYPPASLDAFKLIDGVDQSLNRLKQSGYLLIVVTNQPDVARGVASKQTVDAMHRVLMQSLPLDDIRVCFHDDQDNCTCRKPKPGLLVQAALDFNINLTKSYMIGDRWKDIQAGMRARCSTIWLKNNYDEPKPDGMSYTASNLVEAVNWLLYD